MHDEVASVPRPPQELKAFVKLMLAPGESRTVSLQLSMRAFAFFDEARSAWVAEAGRFELRVGASSACIGQRAVVVLASDWVEPVAR